MPPSRPGTHPTTTSIVAARQAGDDCVEHGDNAIDDGVQDIANAVDNGHQAGADGAEDRFHLKQGRTMVLASDSDFCGLGDMTNATVVVLRRDNLHKRRQRPFWMVV